MIWLKHEQATIRSGLYKGTCVAIEKDDTSNIGKKMIILAQYQCDPRWYAEGFQNASAIAFALKMPSIFITITCNDN